MSDFWKAQQASISSSSSSFPSSSSRPGTAGVARPGTSSGRRYLSSSAVTSSSTTGGGETTTGGAEILLREADRDDLLRIMNAGRTVAENEALLRAAQGDLEALRRLIAAGLDLRCRGFKGDTLLHHAASRGHCAVIAELVKHCHNTTHGIDVDARNDAGETPLHLAVYGVHLLAADQLLDYRAQVDARNAQGETPLFYAARKSSAAIVRLLLQRGADATLRDEYDECAIDHVTNPLVRKAFTTWRRSEDESETETETSSQRERASLRYDDLLRVFSFLGVNDLLRAACVCSKWQRVAENDSLWKSLGVRRWELSLKSKLGFAPTPTSSFLNRPRSKTNSNGGTSSSGTLSRTNSGRSNNSSIFVSSNIT